MELKWQLALTLAVSKINGGGLDNSNHVDNFFNSMLAKVVKWLYIPLQTAKKKKKKKNIYIYIFILNLSLYWGR